MIICGYWIVRVCRREKQNSDTHELPRIVCGVDLNLRPSTSGHVCGLDVIPPDTCPVQVTSEMSNIEDQDHEDDLERQWDDTAGL